MRNSCAWAAALAHGPRFSGDYQSTPHLVQDGLYSLANGGRFDTREGFPLEEVSPRMRVSRSITDTECRMFSGELQTRAEVFFYFTFETYSLLLSTLDIFHPDKCPNPPNVLRFTGRARESNPNIRH